MIKPVDEVQIIAPAEEWPSIREDPRFIELMRVARVANSLALAYQAFHSDPDDQSVGARRERFVGLFYAAAMLKEGLHTAQSLGQWFRELPQYKEGFAKILGDEKVKHFQSGALDRIRDELVFHFDRDAIAAGLRNMPHGDVIVGTFPPTGPKIEDTYFDVADDAVLGYLFGDAESEAEYWKRLEEFMLQTADLFTRFSVASHRLVAAGLIQLGCVKRKGRRPTDAA